MKIIKIINNTEVFLKTIKDNDVYLVVGIVRKKDNEISKSEVHKMRFICDSKQKIQEKIKEIHKLAELNTSYEYRIYVSYNSRNVKNALRNFQKTLLDFSFDIENKDIISKTTRLDLKWFSELAKPTSSNKEYMLLDLDTKEEKAFNYFKKVLSIEKIYPTKNGFHFLVKKDRLIAEFHKVKHSFDAELKKDDLLLLEIFKFEK